MGQRHVRAIIDGKKQRNSKFLRRKLREEISDGNLKNFLEKNSEISKLEKSKTCKKKLENSDCQKFSRKTQKCMSLKS